MHSRSFHAVIVLVVIASFAAAMVGTQVRGITAPLQSTSAERPSLQDEQGTPPLIEPIDGSTPQDETAAEGAEGLLPITIGENLGNGGQANGLPREIGVDNAQYLFDRLVPLATEGLVLVASNETLSVYAVSDTPPFNAVYVSSIQGGNGELARYLPEQRGTADVACPSEVADIGQLNTGQDTYIFAGTETDLTPDLLQEVGDSNGQTVYADPDTTQPFPEVFIADADGLQRFVIAGEDGRPASLTESLAFAGTLFSFVADVTDQVDLASLTRVGCAGLYPVYADQTDAASANRYVWAGARLFQFEGEVAPAVEPTEIPTEAPAEEPAALPMEEPTEVPTEVPTEIVATETPTEAPAEVPTEQPTEGVTEEPAAPAQVPEQPTAVPTEQLADEPAEGATEVPTGTATTAAVATQVTPQPTAQLQPPAVVPTQVPNAPPPAAVTAEPATTCAGSPGPANAQGLPSYLPNRIQLGGIAYALIGAEAAGEAGELTRIGCTGAFEILVTDQADRSEVLYLRSSGEIYRFEAAVTFNVEFEVIGEPQRIRADDQQFRLVDSWLPSTYSGTSVILFVEDAESTATEVFYAVNVYNTVGGEVIGEYQLAGQGDQPSAEMVAAAERAAINPDLTVGDQRYVLVNVFIPIGTTTNGFVTLFSASGEGEAELLLGRDMRRLELFIYQVIPTEETGG